MGDAFAAIPDTDAFALHHHDQGSGFDRLDEQEVRIARIDAPDSWQPFKRGTNAVALGEDKLDVPATVPDALWRNRTSHIAYDGNRDRIGRHDASENTDHFGVCDCNSEAFTCKAVFLRHRAY